MASDYQMLSSMAGNSGGQTVKPQGKMLSQDDRSVQVVPYGGDYYTYGQNGGEHQFVDYSGLFNIQPAQQSQAAAMATPTPSMGSSIGNPNPVIQRNPAIGGGSSTPAPSTIAQAAASTPKAAATAQDAQVTKLLAALNQKSQSPGSPTYLDLLTRQPETVMPTSIQARTDPFYGMAGWNQGGN